MVSSVSDSKSSLGIIKDFFTLTLIFFKYSLIVQPPNYYPAWGDRSLYFLTHFISVFLFTLFFSLFLSTFTSFIVPFYFHTWTSHYRGFRCSILLVSFRCTFLLILISLYFFTFTLFIIPFY